MAKRIATQLAEEIEGILDRGEPDALYVGLPVIDAKRWLKWAKALTPRMRLDGSKASKQRKPAAKNKL